MKNKLRRAFDLTKPNVLNRVLEDCPAPENAQAKPRRKRLSDRAVRFISVAASFAILISAVGGGFIYFRDYFAGQGNLSGSNEEPHNSAPDFNLGWDTPEPNETEGVMISEEYAREIALEHAQGSMGACKVVSCELVDNEYYKVGISGEMLCWYSDVYVDAYSGEIIELNVPADVAQDIALFHAMEKYDNCIVYDCELVGNSYYRISISCVYPNGAYTGEGRTAYWGIVYFVDAATGDFRDSDHVGGYGSAMEEDEARKIASAQADTLYSSFLITNCVYNFRSGLHSFYDFTLLAETDHGTEEVHFVVIDWLAYQAVDDPVDPPIGQTLTMTGARDIALGMRGHYVDYIHCLKISENSDFYTVYYEQGEYSYELHIDFDGNVLYDCGEQHIDLRADQQMAHLIGWEKARSIALNACGREAHELIGFTYEYYPSDPDYYHLELYFEDDGFTYRIGALNGELLEGPTVEVTPPEGAIDIEKATQIAMEYTGHLEDYLSGIVTDLAAKFDEHGNPAAYYIYFRVGSESFEVGIDAATGTVLFCNGYAIDKPDVYPEEDAINVALSFLPLPDTYPVVECHQIGTEPGRIIYMVVCRKPGMSVTTMVDGNTLRIMDHGIGSSIDVSLTAQNANSIALQACDLVEEGPAATPMLGIFNDGTFFYCVKVYWDEMVHVVVLDANSGEVLSQIEYENTRIPGHIISEDQALEYALANAFVSLADAEDPTVVHDADSQSYTVTFRYQGDLCTVIVDDYYGSVIDMYWIVDE